MKSTKRQQQQKWYKRHAEAHKANVNARRRKNRDDIRIWFAEYKSTLTCIRCPENHPACLDFHHRDATTKKFSIGNRLTVASLEKLKEEIAKCDVLCSNCHRKHHFGMRL